MCQLKAWFMECCCQCYRVGESEIGQKLAELEQGLEKAAQVELGNEKPDVNITNKSYDIRGDYGITGLRN